MRKPPMWLESAVDRLDIALLVVGGDYTVSYANFAAHRIFGVAPGALEGTSMERLIAAERRGELRNIGDVLAGGSARRVRSVLKRDDGSRIDVTMTIEPCFDAAGQVGAVSVRYEAVPAGSRTSFAPSLRTSMQPNEQARVNDRRRISSSPVREAPPAPTSARVSPPPFSSSPPPGRRSNSANPPRHSEPRLSRARTASELELRLHRLQRNLQWLEERLSVPSSIAPLDDSRERARAMLVVNESRGLVQESLADLDQDGQPQDQAHDFPAPPKLPKL